MKKTNLQKGFTLIEVIVVLILVGLLSAIAGTGLVAGVQAYLFSKDNASVSAKVQLAMVRINRELLNCYNCSGTSGNVASAFTNDLGTRYLRLNNGNIELSSDGTSYDTLLGDISSFSMTYNTDYSITVRIQSSKQPGGVTIPAFTTRVHPRNS